MSCAVHHVRTSFLYVCSREGGTLRVRKTHGQRLQVQKSKSLSAPFRTNFPLIFFSEMELKWSHVCQTAPPLDFLNGTNIRPLLHVWGAFVSACVCVCTHRDWTTDTKPFS